MQVHLFKTSSDLVILGGGMESDQYHLFKTSSDLEILGGGGNLFNDSILDEDIGSEMSGGHY